MIDIGTKISDLLRDDDDDGVVVVSRIAVLVLAISTTGNDWQSYIYSFDRYILEKKKKRTSECVVYILAFEQENRNKAGG